MEAGTTVDRPGKAGRHAITAMCVALAEANHPIRLSFEVGRPMPLHGGAAAEILAAGAAAPPGLECAVAAASPS